MQPKTLTGLLVVTAAAVAVAAASSWTQPGSATTDKRGEALFPGLAEQANQLTTFKFDAGDWQTEIRRDGERYLDASGFPVKLDPIRSAIAGLSTLTYEEAKTSDPERYADLELADPSPDTGAGRLISLRANDQVLAELVVGERDLTVGGMSGGIFARQPGQQQTWLLRGSVPLPADRSDLFETQLLDWNSDDVAGLRVSGANEALQLNSAKAGEPLQATNPAPNAKIDAKKVLALGAVVNNLRFDDVRKAGADRSVEGSLQYESRAGVQVTLERLANVTAGANADAATEATDDTAQRWVRLRVNTTEAASDEGREQARALAAKADGFEFQLSESTWEAVAQTPADLQAEPNNG